MSLGHTLKILEVLFLSLEEKTKELAEEIKNSSEYQELTAAQSRVQLDPKAQDIVNQIQNERQKVQDAQMQGEEVDQNVVQNLQLLQQQAEQNETLSKLFEAQEDFNKIMERVNKTLTEELY